MSSRRLNFHRYEPVEWRLLLVTDGSPGALQLQRHLERSGYRVTTAADAQDALAMLRSGRFHILITDWNVTGMDGGALCRALRSESLPGYVYTLVITEPEAKSRLVEALEAGADDSLVKPISESELLARLKSGRRIVGLEQSLREANEENRRLSVTDALTGAFNRRHLVEQLPREIARCRRYGRALSVVMCDIDLFKSINDNLGHRVGDEVLREFVRRIVAMIRRSDWLARYGGEEFLLVLPETPLESAVRVAEKIRSRISHPPLATSAGDVALTASLGVASLDLLPEEPGDSADELIRMADAAMYLSKRAGRDRVTATAAAVQSHAL